MLPYRITFPSANQAQVYVYDNEAPSQERVVTFTLGSAGWSWQYTFSGSIASYGARQGGCTDIFLIPLTEYTRRATPLQEWCGPAAQAAGARDTDSLLTLPSSGEWAIRNGNNEVAGFADGVLTTSIAGAYQIPEVSGSLDDQGQPHSVVLPAGAWRIDGSGLADAAGVSLYDDGKVVAVSMQPENGTAPQVAISPGLETATIGHAAGGQAVGVLLITELPDASRTASVEVAEGIPASLSVGFDGDVLTLLNSSGATAYTVTLAHQGEENSTFASGPIAIAGNEKHLLSTTAWSNVEAGVTLQVDRGSDGTIDESTLLEPTASFRIYLPAVHR